MQLGTNIFVPEECINVNEKYPEKCILFVRKDTSLEQIYLLGRIHPSGPSKKKIY